MKPITRRLMNTGDWRQVYQYDGSSLSFTIYACDQFPGMTIAYERRSAGKVKTFYTVFGKRTDSPTQAVRLWNAKAHEHVKSGRQAPGSPQSAGRSSRGGSIRC